MWNGNIRRRNENNNIDDENKMFIRLQFPNDFRKRLIDEDDVNMNDDEIVIRN
jgi:hypothetical protein